MTEPGTTFKPDWVSPPGDSIVDMLEERDWTQAELAQRIGYTTKHVNQLIKGKVPLTEDAAIRLERVIGGMAGFWLAREAQYREQCARLAAAERYVGWTGWLDQLPVKELMQAGAIKKRRLLANVKPALVEELLRFFGVASPGEWDSLYAGMQGAFRRTRAEQSDIGAISGWLRMGEKKAECLDWPKYDRNTFAKRLEKIRDRKSVV